MAMVTVASGVSSSRMIAMAMRGNSPRAKAGFGR
jgi:hypothetical protein